MQRNYCSHSHSFTRAIKYGLQFWYKKLPPSFCYLISLNSFTMWKGRGIQIIGNHPMMVAYNSIVNSIKYSVKYSTPSELHKIILNCGFVTRLR